MEEFKNTIETTEQVTEQAMEQVTELETAIKKQSKIMSLAEVIQKAEAGKKLSNSEVNFLKNTLLDYGSFSRIHKINGGV